MKLWYVREGFSLEDGGNGSVTSLRDALVGVDSSAAKEIGPFFTTDSPKIFVEFKICNRLLPHIKIAPEVLMSVVDNSRGDYDIVNARGRSPCGPNVTNSSVERDGVGSRTSAVYFQNEPLYPVVYDSPSATVRELWRKYLREIASSCQFPRLVMGDFNDVSSLVEKLGGRFCFRKAEISRQKGDQVRFISHLSCTNDLGKYPGIPPIHSQRGLPCQQFPSMLCKLHGYPSQSVMLLIKLSGLQSVISGIQVLILQLTSSGSLSIRVIPNKTLNREIGGSDHLARGNLRIITGFPISLSFNCSSFYYAGCGHGREDMLLLLRDCQWARSVWLGSDVFITLVKRICLFMCALAGLSGERMTAKENQSKKKENAWTTLSKILDNAFKDLIVACDMIFIF
ncbi:hypothetical protein POTOM_012224 [Populus tomentosa]|uniref:DNAse I-like superfamily protein n=1 Tax=Populus tomentosa TaxID=118781 RepID=A0A8X8A6Q1_POPTO|nr:hypothetical protein POTOM_012224 [Populus tomentosa]